MRAMATTSMTIDGAHVSAHAARRRYIAVTRLSRPRSNALLAAPASAGVVSRPEEATMSRTSRIARRHASLTWLREWRLPGPERGARPGGGAPRVPPGAAGAPPYDDPGRPPDGQPRRGTRGPAAGPSRSPAPGGGGGR